MRRRRQALRPNTFPFMAVLLCAMGSLILLLMVFDRRAKLVSKARAMQASGAVDRAAKEKAKAAADQEAEWQRRQAELHAYLLQQQQQVLGQLSEVQAKKTQVQDSITTQQEQQARLLQLLQIEQARLEQLKGDKQAKQSILSQAKEKTGKAQQDLAKLTGELLELELALTNLHKLREHQKECFSVVPYKGNRGDNRQPHYLECVAGGLIFHPDQLALIGLNFSPLQVRQELEKRIQAREKDVAPTEKNKKPYLFVLVRPDGLSSYYDLYSALAGLPVDLGYELIDRDWVLDFSDGKVSPGTQTVAPPPPADAVGAGKTVQGFKGGNMGAHQQSPGSPSPPDGFAGGVAGPPGHPPGGTGIAQSATGLFPSGGNGPFPGGGPSGPGDGGPAGFGKYTGQGPKGNYQGNLGFPGASSIFSPSSLLLPPGFSFVMIGKGSASGNGGLGQGIASGSPSASGPGFGGSTGLGQGKLTFSPGIGGPGSAGNGFSGSAANPSTETNSPFAPGVSGSPGSGTAVPGGTVSGSPNNGSGPGNNNGGPGSVPGTATSSGTPKPPVGSSPAAPGLGSQAGTGQGTNAGAGNTNAGHPSKTPGGAAGQAGPGEPEPGMDSLPNPWATGGKAKPSTKAPLVLSKVMGNRDWNINFDCSAQGVTLLLTQEEYSQAVLDTRYQGEHPLHKAVREAIARKQATVRPGEPPYRPILYFDVPPGCLRSYLLAQEVLGNLQLPAIRHNVPPRQPKLEDYFRK